jgi:hypothetical protein
MPCAPPAVAPSPISRQNKETLAWLALRRSKLSDVDVCPHSIFICSSILRRKPTNLLPHSFEAQTKKLSWWFWCPNHQTVDFGFEVKTKKPSQWFWCLNHQTIATGFETKQGNSCLSSPPHVRCKSHTASPDLLIVRPSSTRLVPHHPRSSAPRLLLLSWTLSLPAMSHSSPTHHDTSKHVSPHWITQYGLVQPKCVEFKFKLEQVNYSSHI